MRALPLALALLFAAACGSAERLTDSEFRAAERGQFLENLENRAMSRVNHCESQTRAAEALSFVSAEFSEMQRTIRLEGRDALEAEHEVLLTAFSEPIGFPETSDLRWDPLWLEDAFVGGETEWTELVYAGGLQVANQYAFVLSDA